MEKSLGDSDEETLTGDECIDYQGSLEESDSSAELDQVRIENEHEEKQFECDVCKERFARTSCLLSHAKTHTAEQHIKCNLCEKIFTDSRSLLHHKTTQNKPYECDLCKKQFSMTTSLIKHKKCPHNSEALVEEYETFEPSYIGCAMEKSLIDSDEVTLSGDEYSDNQEYFEESDSLAKPEEVHIENEHEEKQFECDICKERFARPSLLLSHVRTHTGEQHFKCNVCEKIFTKPRSLSHHKATHSKPYECKICKKRFSKTTYLIKHRKCHHGVETLAEEYETSQPRYILPKPLSVPEEMPIKVYECDACDQKFIYSDSLSKHKLKTHIADINLESSIGTYQSDVPITGYVVSSLTKSFQCGVCGKISSQLGNLKRHMDTHKVKPQKKQISEPKYILPKPLDASEKTPIKLYECSFCEKKFMYLDSLNKHSKIHKDSKRDNCDVLSTGSAVPDQCSVSRIAPVEHQKTDSVDKLYQCDICQASFCRLVALNQHKKASCSVKNKTNTGGKPYKCDVCKKQFLQYARLKRHEKTGSGCKPYGCDTCNLRFASRENLQIHLIEHLEDAPILCKTCGKEIFRSQELQEDISMRFKLAKLKSDARGNNVSYQCESCQDTESNEPLGTGYVCSFCSCGCGSLKELEAHMVIHNDHVDTEKLPIILYNTVAWKGLNSG